MAGLLGGGAEIGADYLTVTTQQGAAMNVSAGRCRWTRYPHAGLRRGQPDLCAKAARD